MSDIVERLHIIRNHLSTGALGQREVWEDWLTEAAAEIERLRAQVKTLSDDLRLAWRREDAEMTARAALEPKP